MYLDKNNRADRVEVLPDMRLRVTERFDAQSNLYRDVAHFESKVLLPWATPHPTFPDCRLIQQPSSGQIENAYKNPSDPPPELLRVYEEIPANDQVQVGNPNISYDQYGNKIVSLDFLQFSTGTTTYSYVVGTTTAPAPNSDAVLQKSEQTDDGTLKRTTRTFITAGQLSESNEEMFDGKLLVRTAKYLNQTAATPSGYTLVSLATEYINGLPVRTYKWASASASVGAGGEISRSYDKVQGGTNAFDPASPNGGTGAVRCVIRWASDPSVTTDPTTGPTSFVRVGVDFEDKDGWRLWTVTYGFGAGLVVDETQIVETGALVVYHRVSLGSAPTTPSATISGTVTVFETTVRNEAGYLVYDYRYAEGNGQSSITTDGQQDGALIYTVVTNTAAATTPAYPGSGTAYLVRLSQAPQNGYFRNTAVYHKPPATVTLKQMRDFRMPGLAQFSGNDLIIIPPSDITIEADVEISYDVTQNSDVPYKVDYGAYLRASYIRTNNNSVGEYITESLSYILAGSSGISGTAAYYNGALCDSFSATLNSSSPTARPSGLTVIDKDNQIYLVATDGTVVYRRTKVSYTF